MRNAPAPIAVFLVSATTALAETAHAPDNPVSTAMWQGVPAWAVVLGVLLMLVGNALLRRSQRVRPNSVDELIGCALATLGRKILAVYLAKPVPPPSEDSTLPRVTIDRKPPPLVVLLPLLLAMTVAGCTAHSAIRSGIVGLEVADAALDTFERVDEQQQARCVAEAATFDAGKQCLAAWRKKREPALIVADELAVALTAAKRARGEKRWADVAVPLATKLRGLLAAIDTSATTSPEEP